MNTNNKKRIGLVTWLGDGNYGTSLQAFALYKFLTDNGYDCSFVDQFDFTKFKAKSILRSYLRPLGIIEEREKKRFIKKDSKKLLKLWNFLHSNIKRTSIDTRAQYNSLLNNTYVFCVGSDQVWNAYYNFNPFNFLNFAGENKRISYASSMGTKDFPDEYKKDIKQLLSKFAHISLREETGRKAVSDLTGRTDVKKVLDPTFLLNTEDWQQVGSKAEIEIDIPKEYILVYLIGNNEHYAKQVEDLKQKTGISNIIVIPAAENPNMVIEGATIYHDAAVAEFIYLLSHATWVCTDSFHATAISINMGKNFTEFLRFNDGDKASQNSRIYDVLNTFKLSGRLYNNDNYNWATLIDYTTAHNILDTLRKDSSEWLIDAIEH